MPTKITTNIHTHLFSADHAPSAQVYFLLRGALQSAARRYLRFVLDEDAPTTVEMLQKLDRSLDRFEPPWPKIFELAIAASGLAGSVGLIRPARLIDMFTTVARLNRDETRRILGLDAKEREADFLESLIRRKDLAIRAKSPFPFQDALCALVADLYAAHERNAKDLGRVSTKEVWTRFINSPGASQYDRVVALSVNMDEAFLQEILPGLTTSPKIDFDSQAQELEALAAEVTAQGRVTLLPFLCVEPRGYDAGELLERVQTRVGKDKPWKGLKFYPSMGLHPADVRLNAIFDYCQDMSIPILTHCSHGGAGVRGSDRNYGDFSSPDEWETVLDRLANRESDGMFKLCLAHFDALEAPLDSPNEISWSNRIIELMAKYDGKCGVELYADVAFDLINGDTDRSIYAQNVKWVQDRGLADRVLFGSDWWMYLYECVDEQHFIEQLSVDKGFWKNADFEAAAKRFLGGM